MPAFGIERKDHQSTEVSIISDMISMIGFILMQACLLMTFAMNEGCYHKICWIPHKICTKICFITAAVKKMI